MYTMIIKSSSAFIIVWYLWNTMNCTLTMRDKHRWRVFEKRVLRKIFGPERDEVTGEWIKLHNEELNYLYCSPSVIWASISGKILWAWHVEYSGERRDPYRILVRKPERTRSFGKLRYRWEIISKWIFKKWDGAWTELISFRKGYISYNLLTLWIEAALTLINLAIFIECNSSVFQHFHTFLRF